MKTARYVVLPALCFLMGCGDSTPKTAQKTNAPGNNPLNAPADYLGGLANSQNKAVATVDVASLTQAIQMFNVDNGRYPKNLDELVQAKLIAKIPDAPRGKKLSYDPNAGMVKIVDAD